MIHPDTPWYTNFSTTSNEHFWQLDIFRARAAAIFELKVFLAQVGMVGGFKHAISICTVCIEICIVFHQWGYHGVLLCIYIYIYTHTSLCVCVCLLKRETTTFIGRWTLPFLPSRVWDLRCKQSEDRWPWLSSMVSFEQQLRQRWSATYYRLCRWEKIWTHGHGIDSKIGLRLAGKRSEIWWTHFCQSGVIKHGKDNTGWKIHDRCLLPGESHQVNGCNFADPPDSHMTNYQRV